MFRIYLFFEWNYSTHNGDIVNYFMLNFLAFVQRCSFWSSNDDDQINVSSISIGNENKQESDKTDE